MTYILHIETATNICSICISKEDEIIAFYESDDSFSHAKSITILIDKCLREAKITMKDLSAVSVSKGPGSYTALRVGSSTAKGICYAMEIPMIAVDTLKALALASQSQDDDENTIYCPMIDARRMEVYASLYNSKMDLIAKTNAIIIDENSFSEIYANGKTLKLSGDGAEKCKAILQKSTIDSNILCSSNHLVVLAMEYFKNELFVDIAYFEPTYFKPPNITTPKKLL